MMRPKWMWLAWAMCVALAACAMAWVTAASLELEAQQHALQRSMLLEERVRLALWRMESQVTPMLAQEMALTHQAFASGLRSLDAMRPPAAAREVDATPGTGATPGAAAALPDVAARFELRGDEMARWYVEGQGVVVDAQLAVLGGGQPPPGSSIDEVQQAEQVQQSQPMQVQQVEDPALDAAYANAVAVAEVLQQRSLVQAVSQRSSLAMPPGSAPGAGESVAAGDAPQSDGAPDSPPRKPPGNPQIDDPAAPQSPQQYAFTKGGKAQSKVLSETAYQQRAEMVTTNTFTAQQALNVRQPSAGATITGKLSAHWQGDGQWLVIAWPVVQAGATAGNASQRVQGFAVSWPKLSEALTASADDLLPSARLERKGEAANWQVERSLVSLPVMLQPGSLPKGLVQYPVFSPTQLSLAVAWALLTLAAGAMAMLLHGAIALSERRAAFVSAVTHELRTPLTTFRVYTEMLAAGMVPDKDRQQQYLVTLHREAERLMHLVENVLAFARLERGRAGDEPRAVDVHDLIDRLADRLHDRCAAADMQLVVERWPDADHGQPLMAMAGAISAEQIIVNLVDNACKYAGDASDRRIHLNAGREGDRVVIAVADHGPGLDAKQPGGSWRPFHKSAEVASESAPGIGLGLALSRRLAANMGGRLEHDTTAAEGARFRLVLPGA